MPNLKNIIDASNKRKNNTENQTDSNRKCNCVKKDQCPLQNQCLSSSIVYQATVTTKGKEETYIGVTENQFKARFANHKQSFKNQRYKHQTELSKYIWSLKEEEVEFNITWRIIRKAEAYNNISKRCNLCTTEKWFILCKPSMATLNTRVELINNCRHKNRFLTTSQ